MKLRNIISRTSALFAVLVAMALSGCVSPRANVPGTLFVHVNLPPTTDVWREDRVKLAFTDIAREVFHRHGFDRPVEEAMYATTDDLEALPYLLTINLHEWRVSPIGNIQCTFTADLQTPAGTRHLGVFSDTELRGFGGGGFGRWGIARQFEDAAEGALDDLVRVVARAEVLERLRQSSAVQTT